MFGIWGTSKHQKPRGIMCYCIYKKQKDLVGQKDYISYFPGFCIDVCLEFFKIFFYLSIYSHCMFCSIHCHSFIFPETPWVPSLYLKTQPCISRYRMFLRNHVRGALPTQKVRGFLLGMSYESDK